MTSVESLRSISPSKVSGALPVPVLCETIVSDHRFTGVLASHTNETVRVETPQVTTHSACEDESRCPEYVIFRGEM